MAINSLVTLLIYLIIFGVVIGMLYFGIEKIPMPQPIKSGAYIVIALIIVIVALFLLLSMVGKFPGL